MSNTKETASLILRTVDISGDNVDITTANLGNGSLITSVGSITENGQCVTWNNIDFRNLLGDMYDKYDKFNINLNGYVSRKVAVNLTDYDATFFVSGLPFSNQTYNVKTGNNGAQSVLWCTNLILTTNNGTATTANSNTMTIYKPKNLCNITINIFNGLNARIAQVVNHQTFIFDITGCDGYERNKVFNNQEILNSQPLNNRLEFTR